MEKDKGGWVFEFGCGYEWSGNGWVRVLVWIGGWWIWCSHLWITYYSSTRPCRQRFPRQDILSADISLTRHFLNNQSFVCDVMLFCYLLSLCFYIYLSIMVRGECGWVWLWVYAWFFIRTDSHIRTRSHSYTHPNPSYGHVFQKPQYILIILNSAKRCILSCKYVEI